MSDQLWQVRLTTFDEFSCFVVAPDERAARLVAEEAASDFDFDRPRWEAWLGEALDAPPPGADEALVYGVETDLTVAQWFAEAEARASTPGTAEYRRALEAAGQLKVFEG